MKVFLSWSKEPSKTLAKALNVWLPTVIQAIEPWMSDENIPAGTRWHNQISEQLATTRFGIVCVTPENQHEPWLQFEAGALARTVKMTGKKLTESNESNFVCPYLVGLSKTSLTGPLTAFQSVEANRDETYRLVQSLNEALRLTDEKPLRENILETSFERAWPSLEKQIMELPWPNKTESGKYTKRNSEEILEEILELTRSTNRKMSNSPSNINLENTLRIGRILTSKSALLRKSEFEDVIRIYGDENKVEEALRELQRGNKHTNVIMWFEYEHDEEAHIHLEYQSAPELEEISGFVDKVLEKHNLRAELIRSAS